VNDTVKDGAYDPATLTVAAAWSAAATSAPRSAVIR
jgi:hypothetical protein